jgi:hypothetical protein
MATELCSDTLLTATVRKAKFDIIYAMSVFTLTSFNFPHQSYKCCAVSVVKYLNDILNSLKVLPTIVSCHKRWTAVSLCLQRGQANFPFESNDPGRFLEEYFLGVWNTAFQFSRLVPGLLSPGYALSLKYVSNEKEAFVMAAMLLVRSERIPCTIYYITIWTF